MPILGTEVKKFSDIIWLPCDIKFFLGDYRLWNKNLKKKTLISHKKLWYHTMYKILFFEKFQPCNRPKKSKNRLKWVSNYFCKFNFYFCEIRLQRSGVILKKKYANVFYVISLCALIKLIIRVIKETIKRKHASIAHCIF